MKLKRDFIVHNKKGETLLIPTGNSEFSGIVQGNKTFGAIVELLQEETTVEAMVEALFARFDITREKIEADVQTVITELKKIGALDE